MEQMEYFSPDGKESGWYDKGKQPEGWTSTPADVQPGEGDGTLKGYDPDTEPDEPEAPEHTGGLKESDVKPVIDAPVIETEDEELARLQSELDALEVSEKPSGKQKRQNKH